MVNVKVVLAAVGLLVPHHRILYRPIYVYIYLSIYIYISIDIYVYLFINICMRAYICTPVPCNYRYI